jgi:hypothetical protein
MSASSAWSAPPLTSGGASSGRQSDLDLRVAAAAAGAPALVARLYRLADVGSTDGATDEASRLDAIRRAGLADLSPDKLQALIARARS